LIYIGDAVIAKVGGDHAVPAGKLAGEGVLQPG
jgi:hypothetical protein